MQINTNTINILFNIVFISQIILLSWYYPNKIINRIKKVMKDYPPSEYPKLYLKPQSYYQKKIDIFSNLTFFGLISCFSVVLISWSMGNSPVEEMLIVICFALQIIPILLLGITSTIHFKNMKIAHKTTSRSANLQPRKFFDFVSPLLFSFAIILFITFMYIYLYTHDYDLSKTEVLITFIGAPLLQFYFMGMLIWKLNSGKSNPLISEADRVREIKVVAKIAVYASIAMSVFLIMMTVMDEYKSLDALDPVILSLYMQLITVFGIGTELRSVKIDQVDFDVYKNDEHSKLTAV